MRLDAMRSLILTLSKAKDEDELLGELAWEMQRASGAGTVEIMLRDPGEALVLRASTTSPELVSRLRLGKGIGLCGHVMKSGKPIFVTSKAAADSRYANYPGIEGRDTESLAIFPLNGPDGKPFGVVELGKSIPWTLSAASKRDLAEKVELAGDLYLAYHSAYEAGTQVNRLGALSEVSKTIATSPYVEEILQLLVNLTAQQFNYRVCTVRLLDEHRGELVLRATQAPAKAYQRKRAIKLGESIAGRAIAENRPIIVHDVQLEEDYIGTTSRLSRVCGA